VRGCAFRGSDVMCGSVVVVLVLVADDGVAVMVDEMVARCVVFVLPFFVFFCDCDFFVVVEMVVVVVVFCILLSCCGG
jgi:GTPase